MKWAFAIQRKIRLAIALAVLMLFIITFSLIESYNINRISKSFNSIYEDRLIPAVDLYSISDHIHDKRDHLFSFIFSKNVQRRHVQAYLEQKNKMLDKLISKYENTLLVKEESMYLQNLKADLKNFQRDELMLLNAADQNRELAKSLYLTTTSDLYDRLNSDVLKLIRVQSEVGKELLAETAKSQMRSNFISKLQIVISIILGLIIMILIMTDKLVNIKQDKYKLN